MTPQMRSGAGAVGSAIVLGLVLGFWCRADSATSGVEGALADLGAPWIVTAFVAGAVTTAAGASTVDQGAAARGDPSCAWRPLPRSAPQVERRASCSPRSCTTDRRAQAR
ncbi:MAG: hypothetical protein WKF58_19020 [Ilumatobacteraceae bacterium]